MRFFDFDNSLLTRFREQDSGKLQVLDILLKRLRAGSHRVLLFAQMTKMLNILEVGLYSRNLQLPFRVSCNFISCSVFSTVWVYFVVMGFLSTRFFVIQWRRYIGSVLCLRTRGSCFPSQDLCCFVIGQHIRSVEENASRWTFLLTAYIDISVAVCQDYMNYRKYKYLRLDGSSTIMDRRDMVKDFQHRYADLCIICLFQGVINFAIIGRNLCCVLSLAFNFFVGFKSIYLFEWAIIEFRTET